eukprot:6120938-Amphidinium_carterae.1
MGQESTNAVQWMREMESANDALDFDLYVDEKKREAVSFPFGCTHRQDRAGYGQTSGKPRWFRSVSQVGGSLRPKDT